MPEWLNSSIVTPLVLVSARQPTRQWTPRHSCVAQSPFTCAQCQLCLLFWVEWRTFDFDQFVPGAEKRANSQSCCPSGKRVAHCVCDVCDGTEQKAEKKSKWHAVPGHMPAAPLLALTVTAFLHWAENKTGQVTSRGRFASAPFVICVGTFCILVVWSAVTHY